MKPKALKGVLQVPGDKSVSHRALIFSTLLAGKVPINNASTAVDCKSTAACLKALGMKIEEEIQGGNAKVPAIIVHSEGLTGLKPPTGTLDAGNSGTTMRLMSGLLAGQNFRACLDGDNSLRKRPMTRVTKPLSKMGAVFEFLANGSPEKKGAGYAPFSIQGGNLIGTQFDLDVASAQVEAAILLAGLQAQGVTTVRLPHPVRDHTRRMFAYLGVPTKCPDRLTTAVERLKSPLAPKAIDVPADISSAAFFLVGACLLPGSDILLKNVGINPGRMLVFEVLRAMGAQIAIENQKELGLEPVADFRVTFNGRLKGTTIIQEQIARGIDEIPILALAGALCDGEFSVHGAEELRYKESDRLQAITDNLATLGCQIKTRKDGFTINGASELKNGGVWKTFHDHRLAMTGLVAKLLAKEELQIEETDSIKISYPGFEAHLADLSQ
jgi:3-phosphoshikimate 1-carboxyvinyltransferase